MKTDDTADIIPPTTAEEWDTLPPTLTSVQAAAALQILPKSLSKYVQRGEMAAPVERGSNYAVYRTQDVKQLWRRRQTRKAQGYIKDKPPPISAPDSPTTNGLSPASAPDNELVPLTRQGLSELLAAAVAEGVRQGGEPLAGEVAALRREVTRLREELENSRLEDVPDPPHPPTSPPTKTWWERLTGK